MLLSAIKSIFNYNIIDLLFSFGTHNESVKTYDSTFNLFFCHWHLLPHATINIIFINNIRIVCHMHTRTAQHTF